MNNNYYKLGSYNVICDRCGQKYKRDQIKKEWTGILACYNCYDSRHPVTLPLPTVQDSRSLKDARPRPADRYVSVSLGLSVWGLYYEGAQGLDPNLTWDTFIDTWDGKNNPDFHLASALELLQTDLPYDQVQKHCDLIEQIYEEYNYIQSHESFEIEND